LLRLWGIGRETLVVVSVGGLMAAVALLPRVIGEPSGQHFALSPMPAAKSTSVTAPTFPPPSPRRAHVRQHIVLGLASSATLVSLAPAPIARPQTRVAPAGRPAGTSLRDAPPHAQPEPVAPAKSPPTPTPITPAAPPSPTAPPAVIPPAPPAVIPPPTPAAQQPAITVTPTAPATVAVGVPIRSTVSARQPAADEQLAAVQSHKHDSSNNSEQGHPNHSKKHAQESSAAPIVALTPTAAAASAAPQESPQSPVADKTSQAPQHETHYKPDRRLGPKGAGDAIPIAPVMPSPQQPEPITVYNGTASTSGSAASPVSSAPDPSSAGLSAPQSSAQQSFLSSPPTRFDTSSHRHDDAAAGPQGHTKGLSETLCRWCGLSATG
jgi:hypothetical protein